MMNARNVTKIARHAIELARIVHRALQISSYSGLSALMHAHLVNGQMQQMVSNDVNHAWDHAQNARI